jgi:uncharacterized membrane protein
MATQEQEADVIVARSAGGAVERVARTIDRFAGWMARHWLAIFNILVAFFVTAPFLAPALMQLGSTRDCAPCLTAGRVIYTAYSPLCHQLPERSYFLFGAQRTYSIAELEDRGAVAAGLNIVQRMLLRYRGEPGLGYKVALCERDLAIFGSLLVGGLVFGLARSNLRRRGREVPRLPIWAYLVALIPVAVDGISQLLGLRESNWILRSITGALFGLATVWLAYPYIQEAMDDVLRSSRATEAGRARRDPQTGQKSDDLL